MTYNELVKAIHDAIDKEAAEHDNKFVTDEREAVPQSEELNFAALMEEFQTIVGTLMTKDASTYGPKITKIIEKYLGKGHKIADANEDQVEMINLIIMDIKDELLNA